MGTIRNLAMAMVGCMAFAQFVLAQTPAAAKVDEPSQVRLRADMHRAMADLIEARSAEKPDPAKVDALADKVQKIRSQITPPAGPGRGWGGPGRGGCAWGGGPGYGRGPGWGGGPGYGRGPGWGGGRGMAWGAGYGWGFVDANRNGVCDRLEQAVGPQ